MGMTKSGFAAIVGRPSAGKSTLINSLCGRKVSIVTPLPQTTRNQIRGIVNSSQGQIVFVDTPGFHNSERKMNLQLRSLVETALESTDLVLYIIDSSRSPGAEETELLEVLSRTGSRIFVVFNKIDLPSAPGWDEWQERLAALASNGLNAPEIFRISATDKKTIADLLSAAFDAMPEGEPMYPQEYYTDQPPEFRISEIIREQAMLRTREEIPHAIYAEVADIEFQENKLWIRAFLVVETESQKGIVVGQGGERIREIGQESRRAISKIFSMKVHLDLRVKAQPGWRTRDKLLKKLFR